MTLDSIVDEVIAASPPVADSIDALTPIQRKELDHLTRRSSITPEAALAVLRGRRQSQHDELERNRQHTALVADLA